MKNNLLLAILSGVLLALGWPTYGFPGLLFIGFIPLLFAEKNIRTKFPNFTKKKLFGIFMLTFLIFTFITTSWIRHASVFGMFAAIIINSLLMSLVFLIFHIIAKKKIIPSSYLFLMTAWIAIEKFNMHWDLSFPWLNLGNGFASFHKWIQWYEFTGIFGGSLWVWIINIGLFKAIEQFLETKHKPVLIRKVVFYILLIVIPIGFSYKIYNDYEEKGEKIEVIALQPNIDPYTEKYSKTNGQFAFDLVELAKEKITPNTEFILAPETTLPESITLSRFKNSNSYKLIKDLVDEYPKANFLSGITSVKLYHNKKKQPTETARKRNNVKFDWYDVYNSAILINKSNNIQVYHKSKLVAGVEQMPFHNVLNPILGSLTLDLGGITGSLGTQKYRSTFESDSSTNTVAPVICYESVYGEYVTDYLKLNPSFIAVITNDGWWENTQGHKQHLSFSKLRAIETRRGVARSANTGISAIINQKGDILSSIPYGEKGVIKGDIISNDKFTYYVQQGDYIAKVSAFVAILLLVVTFTRRKAMM
ncbi:apolipoprotein N-acyltransferase [Aureivirga sp. CE67]|uniref:apolipoprotein N-acyltransferase n=1 Tax=Aureivirga sp. CE67 TaxID=1788983 RepID=UPI0018CAF19A|nr:apolipoprotein N-acyltransferase [Aureivirga sp. CE67]